MIKVTNPAYKLLLTNLLLHTLSLTIRPLYYTVKTSYYTVKIFYDVNCKYLPSLHILHFPLSIPMNYIYLISLYTIQRNKIQKINGKYLGWICIIHCDNEMFQIFNDISGFNL